VCSGVSAGVLVWLRESWIRFRCSGVVAGVLDKVRLFRIR